MKDADGVYQIDYATNEEVAQSINPAGDYKVPYIYDHFEWPHCVDQGYAFHFPKSS